MDNPIVKAVQREISKMGASFPHLSYVQSGVSGKISAQVDAHPEIDRRLREYAIALLDALIEGELERESLMKWRLKNQVNDKMFEKGYGTSIHDTIANLRAAKEAITNLEK